MKAYMEIEIERRWKRERCRGNEERSKERERRSWDMEKETEAEQLGIRN